MLKVSCTYPSLLSSPPPLLQSSHFTLAQPFHIWLNFVVMLQGSKKRSALLPEPPANKVFSQLQNLTKHNPACEISMLMFVMYLCYTGMSNLLNSFTKNNGSYVICKVLILYSRLKSVDCEFTVLTKKI